MKPKFNIIKMQERSINIYLFIKIMFKGLTVSNFMQIGPLVRKISHFEVADFFQKEPVLCDIHFLLNCFIK